MRIACLSGKGGVGKTMIAANLAVSIQADTYIDCDVEEPNGRIFLKPEGVEAHPVYTRLPHFDGEKCNGCKKCVEFCRFHALMYIKEKPKLFDEVCHSCGGCMFVCPQGAITEAEKQIGIIEQGRRGTLEVVTGILNPGEASGVGVIGAALERARGLTIVDCPPGSACSVMESVMDADYCLLVVEPTAFGLHNFKMVHELVTLLEKPCGVIINKMEQMYAPLEEYCGKHELEILGRIPYDAQIASAGAEGVLICEKDAALRELFSGIYAQIGGAR